MFEYNSEAPLDIKVGETQQRGSIKVSDITFAGPEGDKRIAAYLVTPEGDGPFAGIVFAHWYETEASNSNRSQFVDEAVLLAEHGVVSLLVETMWSRMEWFNERDRKDDFNASVAQTVEFRRALDVLLAQPGVELSRVAFVGHDFGGMFGAVLAGVDNRPASYVILAATPLFSDWYLFGPPMPEDEQVRYVEELSAIDPQEQIGRAEGAAFLFQFGRTDPYVPEEKALEFYEAAKGPKRIEWYDIGHNMEIEAAHRDRVEWLLARLAGR
ncbi:MAG: hypothetical protein ABI670_15965 [Chloroflexota bacterium]